jgi:hypothetical protein
VTGIPDTTESRLPLVERELHSTSGTLRQNRYTHPPNATAVADAQSCAILAALVPAQHAPQALIMSNNTPDVAAILTRIRAEVQAQRQALDMNEEQQAAYSAIERQLQRCVEQLEITRVVSAHWPLESRNPVERGINLFNKLVRRYLRWYINPIVEQQNAFNDIVARTLRLQIEAYTELRLQLAALARTDEPPTLEGGNPPTDELDSAHPRTDAETDAGTEPGSSDKFQSSLADTAALQALIDNHGRAEPPAALSDMRLRPQLAQLALRQSVNAHWLLERRNLYERVVVPINKLVRRYLRWLINPIVEQQNAFNAAAAETAAALLAADAQVRFDLAARRAERRSAQVEHSAGEA